MTDQPLLTVAQVQVQAQREELTSRLRVAQERHAEVAYLNATQDGYAEQEAQAGNQVRTLEAALAHLATVQVGALQAEEAARQAERERNRFELVGVADAAAGKALVLADRIDTAIGELLTLWSEFEGQWEAHADAAMSLSQRAPNIQAVRDAASRQVVMREHISSLLARGGLTLPDGEQAGRSKLGTFASATDDRLVHLRQVARTLSPDFPGHGKYRDHAAEARAAREIAEMSKVPSFGDGSPPPGASIPSNRLPSGIMRDAPHDRYAEL